MGIARERLQEGNDANSYWGASLLNREEHTLAFALSLQGFSVRVHEQLDLLVLRSDFDSL